MKVLAIDTSTLVLGVAVADEKRLLGEIVTNLKKNHSVRLMPAIASLMEELDLSPSDLDGIAVACGPGSYTGVRIGVATAKTLAWAKGIPLVGISSLEAVACNLRRHDGYLCPLFDARRGRVYTGLYRGNAAGKLAQVLTDCVVSLEDWLGRLRELDGPVTFLGDDAALLRAEIVRQLGGRALFAEPEFNIPRPGHIARLALERIAAGRTDDVLTFAPQYLQLAEAEAKWLARQKSEKR
ncbi:tRNA (adenosine(37)-N6)-threonylcarbamoyltransferase complex dimerization subunit type 1 TsaB [Bacillaceae bacterium]